VPNIAIFTPNQNPYSETFIQAHKKYLKDKVFYYYGRRNIQLEGASPLATPWERRVLNLKRRLLKKPGTFVRDAIILKSLKENNIDVVLAEYGTHAHHILSAIKKAGLPMVVHFHGFDASITEIVQKHNNYKEVFQYAVKVIAVSKKMEQMLLDLGCPREKLVYNVYGPQPEFLEVQPKFTKKQFIAIGRFTDKKAPYYTIHAFKNAIKEHPDANLIMAGDGLLLNTCKNLVKYYGLETQVDFPGVITPAKYQELLSESLGFVQHSITADNGDMEGTPLAVLEASAAGIPVVSTKHAGIPDIIIHNETGLLCEEHDVEGMANNMIALLDDEAFAKKMGKAGKRNILANFSMERHINALQEILENSK
jgi:glycosyltransferase involved in cell wall biosynthesis